MPPWRCPCGHRSSLVNLILSLPVLFYLAASPANSRRSCHSDSTAAISSSMALWIRQRRWLYFPRDLCCRPIFFFPKKDISPSLHCNLANRGFLSLYRHQDLHPWALPPCAYICLTFFLIWWWIKTELAQGKGLQRYCLTSFMKISSEVEEKVLINSCIVEKGKLWTQLLLYIRVHMKTRTQDRNP